MGDYSNIGITIFRDDIEKFKEVLKRYDRQLPTNPYDATCDQNGNLSAEIQDASCGWSEELEAAANEGLHFMGWDTGCLGMWAESEFVGIGGKIYFAVTPCDFGPVVRVKRDGTVDEDDIMSVKSFYSAKARVMKVMGIKDDG